MKYNYKGHIFVLSFNKNRLIINLQGTSKMLEVEAEPPHSAFEMMKYHGLPSRYLDSLIQGKEISNAKLVN